VEQLKSRITELLDKKEEREGQLKKVRGLLVTSEADASGAKTELRHLKEQAMIRLKRIYNFLCSMLVFAPFALCFVTLRGVFMRFLELTN
jgi:hypothetical protein